MFLFALCFFLMKLSLSVMISGGVLMLGERIVVGREGTDVCVVQ